MQVRKKNNCLLNRVGSHTCKKYYFFFVEVKLSNSSAVPLHPHFSSSLSLSLFSFALCLRLMRFRHLHVFTSISIPFQRRAFRIVYVAPMLHVPSTHFFSFCDNICGSLHPFRKLFAICRTVSLYFKGSKYFPFGPPYFEIPNDWKTKRSCLTPRPAGPTDPTRHQSQYFFFTLPPSSTSSTF